MAFFSKSKHTAQSLIPERTTLMRTVNLGELKVYITLYIQSVVIDTYWLITYVTQSPFYFSISISIVLECTVACIVKTIYWTAINVATKKPFKM